MSIEKQAKLLTSLPLKAQEILALTAELDRRSELEQLLWLIENYGSGRLKDMGETPVTPRILLGANPRNEDSEFVRVRAFRSPPIPRVPLADGR